MIRNPEKHYIGLWKLKALSNLVIVDNSYRLANAFSEYALVDC